MPRYRRINIDGCSLFQTETRVSASDLLPGTAAVITDGLFVQLAAPTTSRFYIVDIGHHTALKITEANPAGDSVVGNYAAEGREFAVLCGAGTYAKDDPITIVANGLFGAGTEATAVGFCQDDVTTTENDFIRVRFRAGVGA